MIQIPVRSLDEDGRLRLGVSQKEKILEQLLRTSLKVCGKVLFLLVKRRDLGIDIVYELLVDIVPKALNVIQNIADIRAFGI